MSKRIKRLRTAAKTKDGYYYFSKVRGGISFDCLSAEEKAIIEYFMVQLNTYNLERLNPTDRSRILWDNGSAWFSRHPKIKEHIILTIDTDYWYGITREGRALFGSIAEAQWNHFQAPILTEVTREILSKKWPKPKINSSGILPFEVRR
jgi:hypothetical protein